MGDKKDSAVVEVAEKVVANFSFGFVVESAGGLSITSSLGLFNKVRAMATRCRCPPLSAAPRRQQGAVATGKRMMKSWALANVPA